MIRKPLKRERIRWEHLRWELEKLYKMPVLYVLLVACLIMNLYLVWNFFGYRQAELHEAAAMLKSQPETLRQALYYDYYGEMDLSRVEELARRETEFSPSGTRLISANYQSLQERAEEMCSSEKESLSYGGTFRLHERLFGTYLPLLSAEGMVLIFLATVYSLHFESYFRTEDLVLSSRSGPPSFQIKLLAAAVFAGAMCLVLLAVSLLSWFAAVDYAGIWDSYVSSIYNAGRRVVNDWYLYVYPYVTWKPMTVAGYLADSLGVILGLWIMTLLLSGAAALAVRNSLTCVVTVAAGGFGLYGLGNLIQIPNLADYTLKCNPVHLIMKGGYWFMDYAAGDSYPGYEAVTVWVWILAGAAMLLTALKRRHALERCRHRMKRGRR